MAEPQDRAEAAALWQRLRSAARPEPASAADSDALMLAAYAEGRLPLDQADRVEDWLALHPDAIGDIVAARQAADAALPVASDALAARAMALVDAGDARILPFRARPRAQRWRAVATWGAMAASLLVTSLVGFALGNDTYSNLAVTSAPALSQDLLDPPTGLFSSFDEELNT